ncbi:ATP-dependent nuclease [Rhodococcus sp. IEGM1428]|uniref:ATP-dependent nuclease n=1 Tax=Rhodococcus sp. IEGM1428 TaxID=3392191 RepID=UPI003D0F4E56
MDRDQQALAQLWANGMLEPALSYIRFPVFKNLATNLRIEFSHPVTALVGPNGSNKTAMLRALQGSPAGNDMGNYWFGTAMDEIPADARHRFIYGRKSYYAKRTVEVIKTRIGRRKSQRSKREIDPDLFEPSRPLTSDPDSMQRYTHGKQPFPDGSTTRWNPIAKPVVYLDFRSQLSAFDWAFHHSEPSKKIGAATDLQVLRSRKDKIRARAKRLAHAIETEAQTDVWYTRERIIKPIFELTADELKWVNKILGKSYEKVRLIKHRYFGNAGGWTIIVQTAGLTYSEAFAGSGEFAAVMIVHSVLSADERSLILLDEPEVSLHPSAQEVLIQFLCEASKRYKHQMVFATHSPEMIRPLPPNAIKVFSVRNDDGKVDLPSQSSSAHVAFDAVGAKFEHPTIVVEDRLAKAVVERAISQNPVANIVQVKFIPGGASTLWAHYVPMWAHDDRTDLLLMLDGDQHCEQTRPLDEIPAVELEAEMKHCMNEEDVKLPFGASEISSVENRRESIRTVLSWRSSNVDFLSCNTPEQMLWEFRHELQTGSGINPDGPESSVIKGLWEEYACGQLKREKVTGEQIYTFQLQALARVPVHHVLLQAILRRVEIFVNGGTHES